MCVQWKVNRSPVYTFLTKISHDVTMNPYWTHLCQKALLQPSLPLYASFSVPPLPHAPSLLLGFFESSSPFLFYMHIYFHILQNFPSALNVSLSPFIPNHTFLSGQLQLLWLTRGCPHSPKMPGCSHKLCPRCGFFSFFLLREFTECMGARQKNKSTRKKTGMGRTQMKEGRGNERIVGKSVVGAARRQPENHIWKWFCNYCKSVSSKGKVFFSMPLSLHIKLPLWERWALNTEQETPAFWGCGTGIKFCIWFTCRA